eukprot:409339_1
MEGTIYNYIVDLNRRTVLKKKKKKHIIIEYYSNMRLSKFILFVSCFCIVNSDAFDIQGKIRTQRGEHGISSCRVTINSGEIVTIPRVDGTFKFDDLPAGSYIVEVVNPFKTFPMSRVNVGQHKTRVVALHNDQPQRYPLVIRDVGDTVYEKPPEPFNYMSLLKNPMVIIVGFTLLMAVVMPKLMEAAETERQQEKKASQPAVVRGG